MKNKIIYLDNNATTSLAPEAREAMRPFENDDYGNASSLHYAGRLAFRAVEDARCKVAKSLSVKKSEIFFNSGATEGNNWIFLSLLKNKSIKKRIVVSSIEHKSVLLAAQDLSNFGFEVIELPVNSNGVVKLASAHEIINDETALVSVHYANNETGVIQPISELVNIAHKVGALFHCDAVQGYGKSLLNLTELGVDSAVFSAHKIHGPKGVGALYLRGGALKWPWKFPILGGGQEQGVRSGTLNVPGIVGFGAVAELLSQQLLAHINHMRKLQQLLELGLRTNIEGCCIHGECVDRISNTTNVYIPGIPSDILMSNLPLFCISNGSACNSGAIGASYVLRAMGCRDNEAQQSIRISTSLFNSEEEIKKIVSAIFELTQTLPKF